MKVYLIIPGLISVIFCISWDLYVNPPEFVFFPAYPWGIRSKVKVFFENFNPKAQKKKKNLTKNTSIKTRNPIF